MSLGLPTMINVWSILLLAACIATASIVALVVWASVDVRKRFRAADNDPVVDENRVIGCEGDCNSCPLQGLHVELRTRARAAEALGAPTSVRLAEPVSH